MQQSSLLDSHSNDDKWGVIELYKQYTRKFSESPPAFHLATCLQIISSIIGRGRYIVQGEDHYYPNLYTLVVAPSSLFKKTSSIGLLKNFLLRVKLFNGFLGHAGSPEGLFNGIRENGGCVTLYYSEVGMLLAQSATRKWMGDILELLNDLYDCPSYYRKRLASGPQTLNNVYLGILAASQLDSLTRYVREHDLISGFLPRFATVFSDKLMPHMVKRPAPDQKLQDTIVRQLLKIREACREPKAMDLSPSAWDYFIGWGNEKHSQGLVAPPQIQPMYGRLETHALKLAIIIHLARFPGQLEIDLTSIQAACGYATNIILKSYRRLVMEELTFTVDERKQKKVLDIIKAGAGEPVSWRDIANGTRYERKVITVTIQSLVDQGRVEFVKGPRGGKTWKYTGYK